MCIRDRICQSEAEAAEGLKEIMQDKKFGASGDRVVVEEFLTGPEVSVIAFSDGVTLKPMVSSMDHKRALDGDDGLNTCLLYTSGPGGQRAPRGARRRRHCGAAGRGHRPRRLRRGHRVCLLYTSRCV